MLNDTKVIWIQSFLFAFSPLNQQMEHHSPHSILIDSFLFAKDYDVENVLLKKEMYLLDYKE